MRSTLVFAFLVLLVGCGSHGDGSSNSNDTVHSEAWDMTCYNPDQATCFSFKATTPYHGDCSGAGKAVGSCPTANCVAGCTTDAGGSGTLRTFYYDAKTFGTADQIKQTCASNGGTFVTCP